MPSPFPGMDPYFESELWTPFHFAFANAIVHQLVPKLRPKYLAFGEEYFVADVPEHISIETRSMRPDVATVFPGKSRTSGAAVAIAPPPLRLATVVPEPVPHVRIVIRHMKKRSLITAIEILSPTNKGGGRPTCLKKRRTILRSSTHLLEIDLVRQGSRVPMVDPLPDVPYFVLLSREQSRPIMDVWPIALTEPLPQVPVPLLERDPDVELDLQAAFNEVYDRGGYDLAIDYSAPPDVPLPPKLATWAKKLLKAAKS